MTYPRLKLFYSITTTTIALAGSLFAANLTVAHAQNSSPTSGVNTRLLARPRHRGGARAGTDSRKLTTAQQPRPLAPAQSPAAPVAVVPPPAPPEYLFGQAQVTVRGNENPVIRLGLAQTGPVIIEFPASDNFFAVHPGGSNIVTYDESPTLATDHYLVFRAGGGFLSGVDETPNWKSEARASISVQMQSGMFVTFLFYPVRDVGRMAHRCVMMYSREEIVAARRAAGLAVNLDGRTPSIGAAQTPAASSRRIGSSSSGVNLVGAAAAGATSEGARSSNSGGGGDAGEQPRDAVVTASVTLESGELVGNAAAATARPNSNRRRRASDLPREAQRALREAIAFPARFNRWSAPTHGLSVSATAPVDLDDQRRLTVVAVKNTTRGGLRIVAGGPDLDLLTLNDAGQAVQVRSINRLHTEASTLGGAIPAGAIIYYAIIYETPVLDAAQRVRLSVAQDAAADQPASAELSSVN